MTPVVPFPMPSGIITATEARTMDTHEYTASVERGAAILAGFPHYPSTAELAAFRRALGSIHGMPAEHPNFPGRAWEHELQRGIGARDRDSVPAGHPPCIGAIPCVVEAGDRHANARRQAAALRSRAYAAEASERILAGDPGWWIE